MADQRLEVDPVQGAVEQELRAFMRQAFPPHARPEAGLLQHIDDVVLQDAGADAVLDVGAGPRLDHDAVDAGEVQEMAEQQPGRAGADDRDLRAFLHGHPASFARICPHG